ncbi:MAG TPA: HAMP domain-containing sensor histidine kinase [Bacteroidota bacterium]|nr:HAMP domain-containing sensor histidine kinase [Bacteroidota bacterium]
MRIVQTIAFRLFLLIASVQTLVLVLLTYAVLRVQESSLMGNVQTSAVRVSEMIRRATRHSMMYNRNADVDGIIAEMSGEPGIEGIRIYNKSGEVAYSTTASELHSRVDVNAEACVSCHHGSGLEHPRPVSAELSRIFNAPDGHRILGLITPIRNEPQCSLADCHAHPPARTILGVLDVKMSLAQADLRLADASRDLLYASVAAVLLVGLISGGFIWLVVRRPVHRLIRGMELVSSGDLTQHLLSTSQDELGQLARTFNSMTQELARARGEITAWSETLEEKVRVKTADLERAHRQMVGVEKMASLGNLASSVAHELNNPLEGILTFARLLVKRIGRSTLPPEEAKPFVDDLKLMADEALRCGNIVKNLLVFARQRGVSFQSVHLAEVIDRCILLMNHHARMHNVEIRKSCTGDDLLECDPDQVQQVLIVLMVNAIEAMGASAGREEGGTLGLDLASGGSDGLLRLVVSDTGIGMSEETKAHIFEPFYTTKSDTRGVGLGLSVAYGILERHHADVEVESAVGKGTVFTLTFPVKQPQPGAHQSKSSSVEGRHA